MIFSKEVLGGIDAMKVSLYYRLTQRTHGMQIAFFFLLIGCLFPPNCSAAKGSINDYNHNILEKNYFSPPKEKGNEVAHYIAKNRTNTTPQTQKVVTQGFTTEKSIDTPEVQTTEEVASQTEYERIEIALTTKFDASNPTIESYNAYILSKNYYSLTSETNSNTKSEKITPLVDTEKRTKQKPTSPKESKQSNLTLPTAKNKETKKPTKPSRPKKKQKDGAPVQKEESPQPPNSYARPTVQTGKAKSHSSLDTIRKQKEALKKELGLK